MGEIWVATEYGKEILERSGVRTPILVMPLGVDADRYYPNCGKIDFGAATRDFKFISVFRWSYRKGFDILLKAFMEEFSANENVSLIMVSRAAQTPEEVGTDKMLQDFNDIKSFIKKPAEELPHIALYTKPIDEKNMPKFYNSANAFILISRGEGFGLPYIEAAACGLPVIGSNCSGQTDFLKEDNSYLVDPDDFREAKIGGNMSAMAKLCHFYEGQTFPVFDTAAIQKTKEHMRYIFENYNDAKKKAEKLRNLIVNNYTWGMAIDRVYNRLREIS
jgi:glycosyltransferase involved in cell wall biosynthesis